MSKQSRLIQSYNTLFVRRIDDYAAAHGYLSRDDMTDAELRDMVNAVCDQIAVDTKLHANMAAALKGVITRGVFAAERKSWVVTRKVGK